MGLKDHLEDGTGHILDLGLDLDYLHMEGSDRPSSLSTTAGSELGTLEGAETEAGRAHGSISTSSTSSTSTSSSCSNLSEESAVSESEDERVQNSSGSEAQTLYPSTTTSCPAQNQSPGETVASTDPLTSNHTKMEFALKLGYSKELVLLVLGKLGPGALINDILGELVKLGTKTETEQGGGSASTQSPSASSSSVHSASSSLLDSCRLVCPSQLALLDDKNLRPVVVDGSNVAMSHGNKEVFSCHGIQLAVDWFLDRGHRDITVFVPAWRKEQSRPDALITDQETLRRLEKEKIVVFTPSRRVQGRRVVCYDDRFIVKLAYESDGIIVSNDNYRDLANEKPEWKKFIDERLLMYSFVNDKFMPPDDPLGRHGPSLENFLRKRPVIPEHRKQPCPYGKKCTYGHKCKFYHPERGSQPQCSVADELRASAKTSSSPKSQGDSLMFKIHSFPSGARPDKATDSARHATPLKRQSDPSMRTDSYADLLDDTLGVQTRADTRRGSSSSSSSCSSSTLASAPGGTPSGYGYQQDWRDHTGEGGISRPAGSSGRCRGEPYPRCESPELGYPSLMRAYSSLSLVVPQNPERFFPVDMRAGSLPSDCSSEGSVSSDSFSPDPLLEDGLKCQHQHQHQHLPLHPHHHHCPSHYPQLSTHAPPGLTQHPHHGYALSQGMGRLQGFNLEDPPSSLHHFKAPLAYMLSPLQVRSGCPGDYPLTPPQSSSPHSQSSPGGRSLPGSAWQENRPPDSRLYERSMLHPQRSYPGQEQHMAGWDPHHHHHHHHHRHHLPAQPCHDPFSFQSLPEGREQPCHSPWARGTHSSWMAPSLPPAHPASSAPQPQDPPALGRYQDLREKVFGNLCNIFSPDQVRVVMARNPHVTDAQQLAAAILVDKSQHGY